MTFGLRFQLIELGLLLRRQHRQHLLTELNSRSHQLGLEARHLGQFLSSQRFVERTAFIRLAQLLPLRLQLIEERFVAFHKALTALFDFSFLIVR